ncbi:hypothetical protein CAEBREN_10998 [Caenorhabditis brenneri]|uniref:Uncharacterized protein n=1 Tax=Caenorhabditis brenneri TaxID=135651 RepID=G0NC66_CAEBE|nr:hypothetical protein CAEBREN_10998 [Caenorhabditis brenneri]
MKPYKVTLLSGNLNHLQKTHLFMPLERLKLYPIDLQMTHAANDMNVEYEAVFEYFEDLKRRNGIPEPSDPFVVITDSHNESNNNQFIPALQKEERGNPTSSQWHR